MALEERGYEIVSGIIERNLVEELISALSPLLGIYSPAGVRNLASKVPQVRELSVSSPVLSVIEPILGMGGRLVRSILFNKSPDSNWHVTWHQDLSIAVRGKAEMPGFSAWTEKEEITHCQPPIEILERMLTIRIHLDPTNEENGALIVCPGSHRLGRLTSEETQGALEQNGQVICVAEAGDALLMRPLILHASSKLKSDKPRRVIHLEYAGCDLPNPLEWWEGT